MLGFGVSFVEMSKEQSIEDMYKLPALVESLLQVGIDDPTIMLLRDTKKKHWLFGTVICKFRNDKVEFFDMEVDDCITLKNKNFTLNFPLVKGKNA